MPYARTVAVTLLPVAPSSLQEASYAHASHSGEDRNTATRLPVRGRERPPLQSDRHRLLDRHRTLLLADGFHRLRATAPAAGGRDVHAPRLPRLLSRGALLGQAHRRCAAPCASGGAA